jgi:hypothetical protein
MLSTFQQQTGKKKNRAMSGLTSSPVHMRPSTSGTPMRTSFIAEDDDARQQRQQNDAVAIRQQLEKVGPGRCVNNSVVVVLFVCVCVRVCVLHLPIVARIHSCEASALVASTTTGLGSRGPKGQ